MIEIQCTSCQTRYRIDERILPDETPTFKCSRCGHVFTAEPRERPPKPREPEKVNLRADESAAETAAREAAARESAAQARAASASAAAAAQAAAAQAAAAAIEEEERQEAALRPAEASHRGEWKIGRDEDEREGIKAEAAEEEVLARPFDEHSEAEPGETLAFDFNREPGKSGELPEMPAAQDAHEWSVGGEDDPSPRFMKAALDDEPDVEEYPRGIVDILPDTPERRGRRAVAAPVTAHSAGFFVGIFALVAFGFGLLSLMLCGVPTASASLLSHLPIIGAGFVPPMSPAKRIALVDVSSKYARLKDGQRAFIVSGAANNVSDLTLYAVQIEAALLGQDRQLARQAVYCGNNLSLKMVSEMTQHELDFFQKLAPPKGFALAAGESAPFVVVFIAPPASAMRFQVRVARADRAAPGGPAADSSTDDSTLSP